MPQLTEEQTAKLAKLQERLAQLDAALADPASPMQTSAGKLTVNHLRVRTLAAIKGLEDLAAAPEPA